VFSFVVQIPVSSTFCVVLFEVLCGLWLCWGGSFTELVPHFGIMVCPWPFLAPLDSTVATPVKPPEVGKSFVQAVSGSCDFQIAKPPPKIVRGKSVRVKINQIEYEQGLHDCSSNIHGRLLLRKGDVPLTTQALKMKLCNLWPNLHQWDLTPLGKGFFEFHFDSVDDMRKVWAMGTVNLRPGLMRFYCWSCDFTPQSPSSDTCSNMGETLALASRILV